MARKNCWEHKNCGREQGGRKVSELGVCPVATQTSADGLHGGKNGGRVCWVIAGTLCGGKVQGTFAAKAMNCASCDFYGAVKAEEASGFQGASQLLALVS